MCYFFKPLSLSCAFHVNMQVTVGCGKVCLFYVGGCAEFTTQDGGVPRWEFFIGDRPHHPGPDKHGRRPPIAQVCQSQHLKPVLYSCIHPVIHLLIRPHKYPLTL